MRHDLQSQTHWIDDLEAPPQPECPYCLGVGTVPRREDDREPCPRCLGAGYVDVFEEMF